MNRKLKRKQRKAKKKIQNRKKVIAFQTSQKSQSDIEDIWTTEEVPLTDELAKELLEAEEISQEQLDGARAMGYELVWNPKRKSIMSAPQMFGGSNVQEKS